MNDMLYLKYLLSLSLQELFNECKLQIQYTKGNNKNKIKSNICFDVCKQRKVLYLYQDAFNEVYKNRV